MECLIRKVKKKFRLFEIFFLNQRLYYLFPGIFLAERRITKVRSTFPRRLLHNSPSERGGSVFLIGTIKPPEGHLTPWLPQAPGVASSSFLGPNSILGYGFPTHQNEETEEETIISVPSFGNGAYFEPQLPQKAFTFPNALMNCFDFFFRC